MIKTWQERCEEHPDHEGIVSEQMIRDRMQEEIDALRQAIEQAEKQEPVAYYYKGFHGQRGVSLHKETEEWQPLYTQPTCQENRQVAKNATTWAGLTVKGEKS
jgi:hypothetical protein